MLNLSNMKQSKARIEARQYSRKMFPCMVINAEKSFLFVAQVLL